MRFSETLIAKIHFSKNRNDIWNINDIGELRTCRFKGSIERSISQTKPLFVNTTVNKH